MTPPDLENGIYNRICFLLVDYMTSDNAPWTKQIFQKAQYPYIKDDQATVQRPGVFVVPKTAEKDSASGVLTGWVEMKLNLSLATQRDDVIRKFINIANYIELMNLNGNFWLYLEENMYGLRFFGVKTRSDYTKAYSKESEITIDFDFQIDLLVYQSQLQEAGYDTTSPDDIIYTALEDLVMDIEVLNQAGEEVFTTH